jgi:diguanylate cyclase (GGDEF)-like protein
MFSTPASESPTDGQALRLAYQATRALLRASDSESAQDIIVRLCEGMGARVVPAEGNETAVLPIDVSLDGDKPLVLTSDEPAVQRLVSKFVVPALADARLLLRARNSQQMLTNDATRDALTGLWNRRSLELAINRASHRDSLALVDLDHFKAVNDTHGHAAGDEVLSTFAAFVRRRLRHLDIIGRLGGEEFVVLFPDTAVQEASRIVCRLRSEWAPVAPYNTTFSAGVAAVPEEHQTGGQRAGQMALALADQLMYQAKTGGRNRVVTQDGDQESHGGESL